MVSFGVIQNERNTTGTCQSIALLAHLEVNEGAFQFESSGVFIPAVDRACSIAPPSPAYSIGLEAPTMFTTRLRRAEIPRYFF